MHHRELKLLLQRAVYNGATLHSPTFAEWRIQGRCEAPVAVDLFARKDRGQVTANEWVPGDPKALRLILHCSCKKCPSCLKHRGFTWAKRGMAEMAVSYRSWMGTLTFTPAEHSQAANRCRRRLAHSGIDFDTLASVDQFHERAKELATEITKYIKRLRKTFGARIRYMIATEKHKSGLPHFHMLVHERDITGKLTERQLREAQMSHWTGHCVWRLAKGPKAVWYIAKYLAKDASTRMRASRHYGKGPSTTLRHSIAQSDACTNNADRRDTTPPHVLWE